MLQGKYKQQPCHGTFRLLVTAPPPAGAGACCQVLQANIVLQNAVHRMLHCDSRSKDNGVKELLAADHQAQI